QEQVATEVKQARRGLHDVRDAGREEEAGEHPREGLAEKAGRQLCCGSNLQLGRQASRLARELVHAPLLLVAEVSLLVDVTGRGRPPIRDGGAVRDSACSAARARIQSRSARRFRYGSR